jgi:signal peptidase I
MKVSSKPEGTASDLANKPASDLSPDQNAAEHSVRAALRTRGTAVLRVAGGSMGPWLRPGDFVVIRRRRWDELNAGCIVVFARQGRLVVHRILRRGTQGGERVLFTKGDAARHPDGPVHVQELLGEVVFIDRECGSLELRDQGFVWSRLMSKLSTYSQFWYPPARLARRFLSRFA